MGHAAFYGLAVASDSWVMYALALFSQCATFAFIHYVERYARQRRSQARVEDAPSLHADRPWCTTKGACARIEQTPHDQDLRR